MLSLYRRSGLLARLPAVHARRAYSTREPLLRTLLNPGDEVAEQLLATNVWTAHKSRAKKPKINGEKTRIHITGADLCKDIGSYLGPSLQRHVGCDIIDLYPGAGVWSRQLRDLVQPRNHILMEPEAALYAPFLEPLTDRPGTRIVPKSGLVWSDLQETLDALPDQKPLDPTSETPPPRNDTLLVTANLAFYSKTRSTTLYLYQLLSAIRSGTLWQQYGLVRMLLWVRPEDIRSSILPTTVQLRSRVALEAEISCESVTEVAGMDPHAEDTHAIIYRGRRAGGPRDASLELQSAFRTWQAVKEQKLAIPKGRETSLIKKVKRLSPSSPLLRDKIKAPKVVRSYAPELARLQADFDRGLFEKGSEEHERMVQLGYRQTYSTKQAGSFAEMLQEYADLRKLREKGQLSEKELYQREVAWNEKVTRLTHTGLSNFRLVRDNMHLFHQDPPVMHWDRRKLEPLVVKAEEFFPNVSCSLVDIQPKAPHNVLRHNTAKGKEGSKVFDLLTKTMLRNSRVPVSERLDDVWPDSAADIIPQCPSLRDLSKGGLRGVGHAEVSPRILNEAQWVEITEAWLRWPFRPRLESVMRVHSDLEEDDDDDEGGVADGAFSL